MFDKLDIAHNMHKKEVAQRHRQYEDSSKRRLCASVETKIRTTFIGALDSIEKHFGRQWGFGKSKEELSERELAIAELWDGLREEILNKGNAQLRAAKLEVEEYDVHWNKKQVLQSNNLL